MKKNTDYRNPLIVQNVQQKEILSFKEALIYLDASESLLYKLVSNRAITFSKPNGGKLYFKKTDLDDWMTQNESKSVRVLENEINNHLKKRTDGKKTN
jgi:excisionase family DNA binding protein